MSVTVIVGGQYGSEGKGKIAAYLASQFAMSIRTGGPNAGHKFIHAGAVYQLQTLPCALINPYCQLAVGAGGVIDLDILLREIEVFGIGPGRLVIDPQASVIHTDYIAQEVALVRSIGSTGKGVGIAVAEKISRSGKAILARDVPKLSSYLGDVALLARNICKQGKNVLLEGAQGFGLSLHHGQYPYVTSRDTTAASICGEAGIGVRDVEDVVLVVRTYPIRVGGNSGPLLDEIDWDFVTRASGSATPIIEYTTVTKRVRRVGRFDLNQVVRAAFINSATQIALTFADYIDCSNSRITRRITLRPAHLSSLPISKHRPTFQ